MKRKKPKNKPIDTWRDVKLRLPASFVKGLSAVRDKDGNAYTLPVARGNAIMNRLAYSLEVAEGLAAKMKTREEQLARAMYLLEQFENRLKENGVDYSDLLKQEEIHDASGDEQTEGGDKPEPGDDSED